MHDASPVVLMMQLGELNGWLRVWPDAATAMRVMLESASARGDTYAAPCLALLDHAMAPIAPGSPVNLLVGRILETTARMAACASATAPAREAEETAKAEETARETRVREQGRVAVAWEERASELSATVAHLRRQLDARPGDEAAAAAAAAGAAGAAARRRIKELEQKLAAARGKQTEAERERDVVNARYGTVAGEMRAVKAAGLAASEAQSEHQRARVGLAAELGQARSRVRELEANAETLGATLGATVREQAAELRRWESERKRREREHAEIEAHNEVLLAEHARLRNALEAETAELDAAVRFVAITESISRLVCAGTMLISREIRSIREDPGSVGIALTADGAAIVRTMLDMHRHAMVLDPTGVLNTLLRATCPLRAMRVWVEEAARAPGVSGASERLRETALAAVASIREDATSQTARHALLRAMWEWADHEGVAGAEGTRTKLRCKSLKGRTDAAVADQEPMQCPMTASTGEMLAALVAARLRSFGRWRGG